MPFWLVIGVVTIHISLEFPFLVVCNIEHMFCLAMKYCHFSFHFMEAIGPEAPTQKLLFISMSNGGPNLNNFIFCIEMKVVECSLNGIDKRKIYSDIFPMVVTGMTALPEDINFYTAHDLSTFYAHWITRRHILQAWDIRARSRYRTYQESFAAWYWTLQTLLITHRDMILSFEKDDNAAIQMLDYWINHFKLGTGMCKRWIRNKSSRIVEVDSNLIPADVVRSVVTLIFRNAIKLDPDLPTDVMIECLLISLYIGDNKVQLSHVQEKALVFVLDALRENQSFMKKVKERQFGPVSLF